MSTVQDSARFVIRSFSEQGFWSNTLGWVYDVASATQYPCPEGYLPVTAGRDAEFVPVSQAVDFQLDGEMGTRCVRCGSEWPAARVPTVVMDAGTGAERHEEACDTCLTAEYMIDFVKNGPQ